MYCRGLVNVYLEVHLHVLLRQGNGLCLCGVREVGEGNQAAQLVVHHKGRVLHHVCEVCLAVYVQPAAYVQVVQSALHASEEVHIDLAVSLSPLALGSVYEVEVACRDAQVQFRLVQVGKVYRAVQCERIVAIGKRLDLVQVQEIVLYHYLVVRQAQVYAVWVGADVHAVRGQGTRHERSRDRAVHVEHAADVALQPGHVAGNETVCDVQGQALQMCLGLDVPLFVLSPVAAIQQGYLALVLRKDAVHQMRTVGIGEVYHLHADVAKRTTLESHSPYIHVQRHGSLLFLLHRMHVAIEHTRNHGHEGHDARQFAKVEVGNRQSNVLQGHLVRGAVQVQ